MTIRPRPLYLPPDLHLYSLIHDHREGLAAATAPLREALGLPDISTSEEIELASREWLTSYLARSPRESRRQRARFLVSRVGRELQNTGDLSLELRLQLTQEPSLPL